MENSNVTIGNRTRDLPACSAVPQPTALPRAQPLKEYIYIYTRRPYFTPFSLTSLINLHHFLIYAFAFSFSRPLAGRFLLRYPLISDGNIIFLFTPFLFTPSFSGTELKRKTWPWYIYICVYIYIHLCVGVCVTTLWAVS
jgi:hypothetical protein